MEFIIFFSCLYSFRPHPEKNRCRKGKSVFCRKVFQIVKLNLGIVLFSLFPDFALDAKNLQSCWYISSVDCYCRLGAKDAACSDYRFKEQKTYKKRPREKKVCFVKLEYRKIKSGKLHFTVKSCFSNGESQHWSSIEHRKARTTLMFLPTETWRVFLRVE